MTTVVVGAGPSGLGCAEELIAHGPVVIVERIPVTGGTAGWDDPEIRHRTRQLERRGVQWRLGATAVRWNANSLTVVGPTGAENLHTDSLFIAGGSRPRTAAECGITGDRPAGVVPATVAEHLLTTGEQLWKRPLILGTGPWADRIARALTSTENPPMRLAIDNTSQIRIEGTDRVTAVHQRSATSAEHRVVCDAVVLADGAVPVRNIVGALDDQTPSVVYIQPTPSGSVAHRIDEARRITAVSIATHQIGGLR